MIARSLTVLSGAMLLLAAQVLVPASSQENLPVVPEQPADARTEAQEREAVEPTVTEPAVADPTESAVAEPAVAEPAGAEPAGAQTPGNAAASESQPSQPAATGGAGSAASTGRFRTMDRLELESSAITGNRELPKVLYIVPWKKADLGDLIGRPANSLLDEVLTPVDRDVFRRQTEYFNKLEGTAARAPGTGPQQPAQPESEQKSPPAPAPR